MERHQRTERARGSIVALLEVDVKHIRVTRAARQEIQLSRGSGDDRVSLEAPIRGGRNGVERERLVRGRRALVNIQVEFRAVRAVQGDSAADGEVPRGRLGP
ncbi:hypothetical protein NUW54_g10498 [Trametes sanguinea]|uniref:Uncharacterized protein n=1 Tax=Trametes sanguinea TaxID=158606 RepID=A0ACC1NYQ1_9APHY|nr:hypothetical protein NUW54_g10498 [Trametes sanguinea]